MMQQSQAPRWVCSRCGANNMPQMGVCFRCGAARPVLDPTQALPTDAAPTIQMVPPRRRAWPFVLAAALLVAAVGAWLMMRASADRALVGVWRNSDGAQIAFDGQHRWSANFVGEMGGGTWSVRGDRLELRGMALEPGHPMEAPVYRPAGLDFNARVDPDGKTLRLRPWQEDLRNQPRVTVLQRQW